MERLNPNDEYGNDYFRSSQDAFNNTSRGDQPPRLHKKASAGGRPTRLSHQQINDQHGVKSSGHENFGQQRKGSLRNVVRRIFGRRGRSSAPEPQQLGQSISPTRHACHDSEPPQQAVAEAQDQYDEQVPHRTLSAPLQITPSQTSASRMRSPYAVEFPQSARLKPLNLGNPLPASGKQLRRRKTLPSVLILDPDAEKIKKTLEDAAHVPPVPKPDTENALAPEVEQAVLKSKTSKRRSRSAGNLKRETAPSAPRKRSEEIQHWRESMHDGGVLRASGFTSQRYSEMFGKREEQAIQPDPLYEHEDDTTTPTAQLPDPFAPRSAHPTPVRSKSSPRFYHRSAVSEADIHSASHFGTEMSQDLEDRVARLEAGLQNFQTSLQRLTARSNRKTVVLGANGGVGETATSSTSRTPSMLADTLFLDGSAGGPNYNLHTQQRPTTSPPPPQTPNRSSTTKTRLAPSTTAPTSTPNNHRTAPLAFQTRSHTAPNPSTFSRNLSNNPTPTSTRQTTPAPRPSDFPIPPSHPHIPRHETQHFPLPEPQGSRQQEGVEVGEGLKALYRMLHSERQERREERRELVELVRGLRVEVGELRRRQGWGGGGGGGGGSGMMRQGFSSNRGCWDGYGRAEGGSGSSGDCFGREGVEADGGGDGGGDGDSCRSRGRDNDATTETAAFASGRGGLVGSGGFGFGRVGGGHVGGLPLTSYFRDSGTSVCTGGSVGLVEDRGRERERERERGGVTGQVVSRFSGSGAGESGEVSVDRGEGREGEGAGVGGRVNAVDAFDYDDEVAPSTPYDAYQTPGEENGATRFPFELGVGVGGADGRREGGMF
ncbi:hypothetical protein MBLNU230_g6621t1 [Neophaeotheca triangularis]